MKFLVRTGCGESLPLSLKLVDEGNEVVTCMSERADEGYSSVGDGLVRKGKLADFVGWADVVVFDSNLFDLPKEAEQIRRIKPVVGASQLSGRLENDRAFAVQMAQQVGLQVPDYVSFDGENAWERARRYVLALPRDSRWVWKPNGESPASTFVADSTDQMLAMFVYWKALFEEHNKLPDFIITEKIEGQEISTEGWFNGKDFYLPNHTLERTRFFDGDHGEKTGCAGNVVWSHDGSLFRELVEPMGDYLRGKYYGPIDINAIIDESSNRPTFLEFTPRFGYDALFGLMQALNSDVGELLYEIANGAAWSGRIRNDFAGAVRMHIPPYPESPSEKDKMRPVGLPVDGIEIDDKVGPFYPIEIKTEKKSIVTSGPDGYVLVAAGNGATPRQAMESAYRAADKVTIPTVRYRMDLADKLEEVYHKISSTGWLGKQRSKTIFQTKA